MISKYIGIPYDIQNRNGVNCWGLVALVYRDLFSDDLPEFKPETDSFRSIAQCFNQAFIDNKHGFKRVDEPENFGVVIMKSRRLTHCGIYYNGKILHSCRGAKQVIFQQFNDAVRQFQDIEFWQQ